MHENKFEKQVQEKMEELQFAPSDAVWENVDKEINKDKKSRRPVFWLFFFLGLTLIGGGYFFIADKKHSAIIATVQQQKETEKLQDQQSIAKDEKEIQENRKENKDVKKSPEEKNIQANKDYSVKAQENKAHEKKANQSNQHKKDILSDKRITGSVALKTGKEKINTGETKGLEKERSKSPEEYAAEEKNNDLIAEDNKQNTNKNEHSLAKKIINDSSVVKKTNTPAVNKAPEKDSASDKKLAEDKKKEKKSSPWEIGFAAGAGASNINQSPFKSTYVTNPSYYTPATSLTSPGAVTNASSKINSGFSFAAGVFASRHLAERISFSAGIEYHYYSTKIHTGNFVDSLRNVYAANASTSQANGYYQNGNSNSYTNSYHFIELPLSMNFQLNKSQKMPLVWEAGVSLSYLISSDALHFDPVTNVYYKNNTLFNKTQLNAVTAIMLGFHIHKADLQIGPELQYGLTRLLNKSTANPEHLFYSGLKISFVPRKK